MTMIGVEKTQRNSAMLFRAARGKTKIMSDGSGVVVISSNAGEGESEVAAMTASSPSEMMDAEWTQLPQRSRRKRKRNRMAAQGSKTGASASDAHAAGDGEAKTGEGFEYLDHTADVQIHSWADTMQRAFELNAEGMFGYMTDLSLVEEKESCKRTFSCKGRDVLSLLFTFLDELLVEFCTTDFVCKRVETTKFKSGEGGEYLVEATCYGERFDMSKHRQGTEVKAITYSHMQVHNKTKDDLVHVYVIIDI